MKRILAYMFLAMCIMLGACNTKNKKTEECVEAYEQLADEMVEARKDMDFSRQARVISDIYALQVKYSDLETTDFSEEQQERVAEVVKKLGTGGTILGQPR